MLRGAPDFEKAAKAAGLEAKTTDLIARDTPIPDLGAAPAVEEAAFKLGVGAVSDPIATDNGTAVIKVLEKRSDAGRMDLVEGPLPRVHCSTPQLAYMVKAKQKMKIEVNRESLQRAAS